MLLIERVEMRAVMLLAGFNEHPYDDPEEARKFRHDRTLQAFAFAGNLRRGVAVIGNASRTAPSPFDDAQGDPERRRPSTGLGATLSLSKGRRVAA